ncbi:MAG: hypothetical protein ABL928_14045 [Sphingorhabdus sp.]
MFRRNEFIHKADENSVKDTIIEITGLKKTDPIVRLMYQSFDAVRSFIKEDVSSSADSILLEAEEEVPTSQRQSGNPAPIAQQLGLSYQINIVLPETENVAVFNAIFKSLRDNLLR